MFGGVFLLKSFQVILSLPYSTVIQNCSLCRGCRNSQLTSKFKCNYDVHAVLWNYGSTFVSTEICPQLQLLGCYALHYHWNSQEEKEGTGTEFYSPSSNNAECPLLMRNRQPVKFFRKVRNVKIKEQIIQRPECAGLLHAGFYWFTFNDSLFW